MIFSPAPRDDPLLFSIWSNDHLRTASSFAVAPSSTAWPLTNLALFVPFSVPIPCIALEGCVPCGATATGNFDVGIYDAAGTRLTSSGATAKGSSVPVNTTTMTNYTLSPNVQYYMALSHDGVANFIAAATAAGLCEALGILEMQTAYVLPSSATYVKTTRAFQPVFGLNFQATGF